MNRVQLADLILERLYATRAESEITYRGSQSKIGHFVIDDLLPKDIAVQIRSRFPAPSTMRLKKSLKEYKYIAAQMDQYDSLLEEAVYAFQDPRIVAFLKELCGTEQLMPDEHLYAGGISMMGNGQFLNPHLDNSHDKDRQRWRVFNLLYYVTEAWEYADGGNLELWPEGLSAEPLVIHSKFNRLAIMATHEGSWHSVSPIDSDKFRCCISNYYFSDAPLRQSDEFHVTSFRGRPGQNVRDVVLQADIALRNGIRKVFKKGIVPTSHVYKK